MKKYRRITMRTVILIFFLIIIYFIFFINQKNDFNIVLITIDTLRADHLPCYGYMRNTSPTIEKIAKTGIIFKNVIAPSSWTAPSMASLFTSVYPINHGVIHGFVKDDQVYKQEVFSDELTTLAEILKTQGYTTFGVASNHHLSERFGFARGFDHFKYLPNLTAEHVNNVLFSWKNKIKQSDKYFLWAHYFDPHNPYTPRDPWVTQYTPDTLTKKIKLFDKTWGELSRHIAKLKEYPQALSNLVAHYDSEINYVDFHIGKLMHEFELDKNTLIIITSDHGEEFLEHDYLFHAARLYKESIDIPLIVKLPNSNTRLNHLRNYHGKDYFRSILCNRLRNMLINRNIMHNLIRSNADSNSSSIILCYRFFINICSFHSLHRLLNPFLITCSKSFLEDRACFFFRYPSV